MPALEQAGQEGAIRCVNSSTSGIAGTTLADRHTFKRRERTIA